MTQPLEPTHLSPPLQNRGRLKKVPRGFRPIVQALADAGKQVYSVVRTGPPVAWPTPRRVATTWRWGRQIAADIRRRRHEEGLTVAVEISPLFDRLTGVGWYLHEVLHQLGDRPGLRLRLYGPSIFIRLSGPRLVAALPEGRAVERIVYEVPDDLLIRRPWLVALLRTIEPLLVAADRNRVLFAPNFVPPRQFALSRRPLVAMVHDMTVYRTPWAMQEQTRVELERKLDRTIARARAILTPSETVRAELLERGGVAPGAVYATWEAGRLDGVALGELPDGVPERFVLHVGTIEPRKNVVILLAAWRQLRTTMPDVPALVLCGKLGWQHESIEEALTQAAAEGWLICPGYTPDATVRALYERAAAVVCPSVYEGFGLPLVEAMAAGTPIVCSDIPVFREVAAGAAIFVPTDDAAGWASAVARVLSDSELARNLRARGAVRIRDFSWQRTADRTLAVWSNVAAPV